MSMVGTRYVTLDGGGSGSRVVIFDERGEILAHTNGPPLNFAVLGRDIFVENLRKIYARIQPFLDSDILGGIVACLAGSSVFKKEITSLLQEVFNKEKVVLLTDIETSFYTATGGQDGLVVSAGTGSFSYGRFNNIEARAGGWGPLFDDEGSGYWIGRLALRSLFEYFETGGARRLANALMTEIGCFDQASCLRKIYLEYGNPEKVSSLSKVVCKLASLGDRDSINILAGATSQLLGLVLKVYSRLGSPKLGVVYGMGGVITGCKFLAGLLGGSISRRLGCSFIIEETPIIAGCYLYALKHFLGNETVNRIHIKKIFKTLFA